MAALLSSDISSAVDSTDSNHLMSDDSDSPMSDVSTSSSPLPPDLSYLFHMLSRLPEKDLSELDVARGWLHSFYGPPKNREHLLCTLNVLQFNYASVVFIVWLAESELTLSSVREALTEFPLVATNEKWFRNAVRFYALHVVDDPPKQVATTIDLPGRCAFDSIVESLPDFAVLCRSLTSPDLERTLCDFIRYELGKMIDLGAVCVEKHEGEHFNMQNNMLFYFAEGMVLRRLLLKYHIESACQVPLLQMDCTPLEPKDTDGYTPDEIEDYLRSFNSGDDAEYSGMAFEAFTSAVQDRDIQEDKIATLALLDELKRIVNGNTSLD